MTRRSMAKKVGCAILAALMAVVMMAVCGCNKTPAPTPSDPTSSTTTTAPTQPSEADGTTTGTSDATTAPTQPDGTQTTTGTQQTSKTTKQTTKTTQARPWESWTGTIPERTTRPNTPNDPNGEVEATSHSMLQTYVYNARGGVYQSEREFLLSAAYYPDGDTKSNPIDTMFDTFVFLSSPSWYNAGDPYTHGMLTELNKNDFDRYFDAVFKSGVNMDALDSAVGKIKTALNKPNYKVNVFLGYMLPHPKVKHFGEVNGVDLDLTTEAGRKACVEWQIDEQIRRFKEKGYKNIQILGFFCMREHLMSDDSFDGEIYNTSIKLANAHATSLGYEVLWNPYNSYDTGFYRWKEMGFTRATQQINYFPLVNGQEQMNNKPKSEIKATAERTAQYDMGVTMEWSVLHTDDGVEKFKDYLEGGVLYGYMNRPYVNYQLDEGPNSILKDCLKSTKETTRSLYGELYKFIKGKLTVEDIKR